MFSTKLIFDEKLLGPLSVVMSTYSNEDFASAGFKKPEGKVSALTEHLWRSGTLGVKTLVLEDSNFLCENQPVLKPES